MRPPVMFSHPSVRAEGVTGATESRKSVDSKQLCVRV